MDAQHASSFEPKCTPTIRPGHTSFVGAEHVLPPTNDTSVRIGVLAAAASLRVRPLVWWVVALAVWGRAMVIVFGHLGLAETMTEARRELLGTRPPARRAEEIRGSGAAPTPWRLDPGAWMYTPTDLSVTWRAFLAGEVPESAVVALPAGACPIPLDWLFDVGIEYTEWHDNSCGEVTMTTRRHLRGWRPDPDPRIALGGQVGLLHVESIAPGLLASWPEAVRAPRALQAGAGQVDAAALDRLGACVPWEDLSIWSGFQWGEAAGAAIEAVARAWPLLRGLDLRYVPWTEGALRALAAAPFLPRLEDLHLCGSPLDERAAVALAEAAGPLVHLDLSEAGLGPAAARAWAPRLGAARRIDLTKNPIGDDGLRALAESGALASVEDLRLSRCDLGDAAIGTLCAADPPRLTGLRLDDNRVTAAGLATLARSPLLARLVHLSISSRSLPEPGIRAGRASECPIPPIPPTGSARDPTPRTRIPVA